MTVVKELQIVSCESTMPRKIKREMIGVECDVHSNKLGSCYLRATMHK